MSDAPSITRRHGLGAGLFAALVAIAALLAFLSSDARHERIRGAQTDAGRSRAAPAPVAITEFLAHNAGGLQDEDGDTPDWIELHNASAERVNLGGWSLTNRFRQPDRWSFPPFDLEPGGYLIVFASGKDRRAPDGPFHTNFKLDARGGYLGLSPPGSVGESSLRFFPSYPLQAPNVSFGHTPAGLRHFASPTPGAGNIGGTIYDGVVGEPGFSLSRGVYDGPLRLRLTASEPGSVIRYTRDGRAPSHDSGEIYEGGIRIEHTTTLRAAVFREGWYSMPAVSHTFVLPSTQAMQQAPPDYPERWTPELRADHDLDSQTAPPVELARALTSLPTIAVAMDPADLFDAESGIYVNPENEGVLWERPASFEFIDPSSGETCQANAGIRVHGRSSRKPMTSPKHSFRLVFRGEYGWGKLRVNLFGETAASEFDTLVLSATSNYSWTFPLVEQRERAQYTRDAWAKETQRAMGHVTPHTRYAHLYLNGLYWGLYVISERPDANFMASYFAGDAGEYDVRKGAETVDGEDRTWRLLLAMASRGFESNEAFREFEKLVDVDNFIDYLILNHYAGNENWDFGNWYAARRRVEGEKFHFFVWDMESILGRVTENSVFIRHRDRPTEIFHRLRENESFRKRFSERVKLHLTGEGVLTPEKSIERYLRHAESIREAIVAESARWGDYRATIHPYRTGPFERYTREQHWEAELERLQNDYFPQRTAIALEQYKNAGLYAD